jgi:hypothetical protein
MPSYSFSKHKIPQDYSYPLKRSVLDTFLDDAGLTQIANVTYSFNLKSSNVILRGDYLGEAYKGWAYAGLSSIRLRAVPSENRKVIEEILVNEALPKLTDWLRKAEIAGNVWRSQSHHLVFCYKETEIVVEEW